MQWIAQIFQYGTMYGPMLLAQVAELQVNDVDFQKKAFFFGCLIVFCIVGYSYLWLEYFLMGIFTAYFSIVWMERLGEKVGEFGDTVFLPLLGATNVIYLGVVLLAPWDWMLKPCMMLLEAIHSSFNGARVFSILKSTNDVRQFHPWEILIETILIEIAPVTLLAHWLGMIDEWDTWDQVGAWGLFPCTLLLLHDFNMGSKDQTENGAIMINWMADWLKFLFSNVEHIVLIIGFFVAALSGSFTQLPRRR